MNKKLLVTGGILALLGIVLGAFASHGLKDVLSQESIRSFETGVRYQMYHAFMLLIVGSLKFLTEKQKSRILYLVLTGVLFFSVSIYFLSTSSIHGFDLSSIGFMTPVGGLILIISWVVFIIQIIKR